MEDKKTIDAPLTIHLGKIDVGVGIMNINASGSNHDSLIILNEKKIDKNPCMYYEVPSELSSSLTENFFNLMKLGVSFAKRKTRVLLKHEKAAMKKELNCGDKEAEAAFIFINPNPREGTRLATKERVCQFPTLVSAFLEITQNGHTPTSSQLKYNLIEKGYSEQTSKRISYLLLSKNKQK